jgi:hypothetical protein
MLPRLDRFTPQGRRNGNTEQDAGLAPEPAVVANKKSCWESNRDIQPVL